MVSSVLINIRTKIKTFGLDYHDLPTMIENVAVLLRILTINIYNNSERKISIYYIRRYSTHFSHFVSQFNNKSNFFGEVRQYFMLIDCNKS